MDNEVYSFALKNALNEIQSACPEVKSCFLFNEDGDIIAGDEKTAGNTIVRVVDSFDSIMEKAEAIGGIENIALESANGQVSVSHMNNLYLVTVTSKNADRNLVNTLTRVLVPTVLKLVEKIKPAPLKNTLREVEEEPRVPMPEEIVKPQETPKEEFGRAQPKQLFEPAVKSEDLLPEPPVNQFIVETIGGLLVPTDTVRIDEATLSQWQELCENRKIERVEIETFGGQACQSKVKPIKDSKYEGKGIIQLPEKIQNSLDIRKGELVRVKPIVE